MQTTDKTMQKNRGLIIPPITTREEGAEHILGASDPIINPSGNWEQYLPAGELQNKGYFEPSACASFGTNHAVATLVKFLQKNEANYSDRALATGSGTDPARGNDPHKVAEYSRNVLGFVPESVLPFDDSIRTLEQFYSPNPLTQDIIDAGNKIYEVFDFTHKWVFQSGTPSVKKQLLKTALQKGAVCVSVYAWAREAERGDYIKPEGTTDNHWVQLVKYDENDCPVIFDSYAEADSTPYLKVLDPLYDFAIAKVYFLTPAQPKLSILSKILQLAKQWLDILFLIAPPSAPVAPVIPDESLPPPAAPVVPPVAPAEPADEVTIFAKAIEAYENSPRAWNNPGAMRPTPLTAELGATGSVGTPNGRFCTFPSYETGFGALCRFIRLAGEGRLKDYHGCTLLSFFEHYAPSTDKNNPMKYAEFVAGRLHCSTDVKVADLI